MIRKQKISSFFHSYLCWKKLLRQAGSFDLTRRLTANLKFLYTFAVFKEVFNRENINQLLRNDLYWNTMINESYYLRLWIWNMSKVSLEYCFLKDELYNGCIMSFHFNWYIIRCTLCSFYETNGQIYCNHSYSLQPTTFKISKNTRMLIIRHIFIK